MAGKISIPNRRPDHRGFHAPPNSKFLGTTGSYVTFYLAQSIYMQALIWQMSVGCCWSWLTAFEAGRFRLPEYEEPSEVHCERPNTRDIEQDVSASRVEHREFSEGTQI